MINWYVETIEPAGGDAWGFLGLQPEADDLYAQLAPRLRRAGCKFINTREYVGVLWPNTTCTVTVQPLDGVPCLVELHTGASRLMPTERCTLPPMFVEAIKRGRLLLALIRPGTLTSSYGTHATMPAEVREHVGAQLDAAVAERSVMAGLARVLDQPAPRAGDLNRRVR